jgi:NAD(P)-dependent dehydrogenase (short-subunit alcohol dehydrogenase family)
MPKTWFITGASRGLGVQIARAALRAGDFVVATGRRKAKVMESLGPDTKSLLSLDLDVTDATQTKTAVDAAVSRFGGIDVLVNNAGYGHLGFFEENNLEDAQAQFAANVFGVMNVTWATLPVMRAARKGRIFNLSSLAGVRGSSFASLYCASKFALEGFSEALAQEIGPLGLFLTIVEPGPFRTDFLSAESLRMGDHVVADYDLRRPRILGSYEKRNGRQPGDPVKLAEAVVRLASEEKPPLRFAAGVMAADTAVAKLAEMKAEFDRWRELSVSLDYDA